MNQGCRGNIRVVDRRRVGYMQQRRHRGNGCIDTEHSVGKRFLDVNVERLPKLARVRGTAARFSPGPMRAIKRPKAGLPANDLGPPRLWLVGQHRRRGFRWVALRSGGHGQNQTGLLPSILRRHDLVRSGPVPSGRRGARATLGPPHQRSKCQSPTSDRVRLG